MENIYRPYNAPSWSTKGILSTIKSRLTIDHPALIVLGEFNNNW